jgi:hypothetical protein
MPHIQHNHPVSRRTTIAGLLTASLAFVASRLGVSAQEASPIAMAGHPMVGTWIVDRVVDIPNDPPTTNVLTADGGLADSTAGADGVWEATGPNTANYTLIVIDARAGTYTMIRGSLEVDATGDTATASYSRTVVAAGGTVVDQQAEATAQYIRLRVEPQDAVGTPLANFPAWTAPPAATPIS